MAKTWKNWAGNQTARPLSIRAPRSLDEMCDLVVNARSREETVKCVGSGHSFTSTAVTKGHLVTLDNWSGIVSIDRSTLRVTVKAGTTLAVLNELLHAEGLALPNLGDIAYQTVAGAISTSTHGTGVSLTGLAGQVRGFTLIDGQGQILHCDLENNADIFDVGRVSIGALGIITHYTLQAVPAFRLHAVERALPLDVVLERIDEFVDSNDHFEFFWLPHTPWALTKRNNRTEEPLQPLPKVRGWIEKTFMENVAFGALCHLGKARPSLIPRLATALPSSGKREYINDSFKIFASPRIVRFYEMETAIPRASLVPALQEIRAMIDAKGYLLNFPVEVRFTAADDIPMSTASERETAYIAVHVFKGMEFEPFFRDVEAILKRYESRPHWGKLHFQNAEELAQKYRRFGEFVALRSRLDPDRVFANDYLKQVLGD
ncbi:MAG: FAD-binding protein [Actinobacteria bacterium]|nr:FAD-binding protein [Actinomycetota bacterium]MTA92978.1 FAD-binding protein [Actinomycetota bacterium]